MLRSPLGGLFRHVGDLVRGQAQRGLQVGIACDSLTGGAHADEVLRSLAPECSLGIHRLRIDREPGWSDFRALTRLMRILRETAPQIIHGHGAKGGAYARLIAPRLRARAVCTPHGGSLHYTFGSLSGALYLSLERVLKHRTDGMIFESEFARSAFIKKIGTLSFFSRVIHNGLYDSEFTYPQNESRRFDFVFAGEIRKLKGIDVLIEAISRVSAKRDIRVLVAGTGPDEEHLRARIDALRLAGTITVSPPVFPVTEALARGTCVVAPSLAESLPYLVLETLAAGIPMLTTRVGGIPEILGPYADRLLPPGDAGSLAQAMLAVLDDPDAARRDAAILQEHIKSHSRVSQMVDSTIDFYHELSDDQHRGAESRSRAQKAHRS